MFMRACVCGSRSRSKRNLVTGDLKAARSVQNRNFNGHSTTDGGG